MWVGEYTCISNSTALIGSFFASQFYGSLTNPRFPHSLMITDSICEYPTRIITKYGSVGVSTYKGAIVLLIVCGLKVYHPPLL